MFGTFNVLATCVTIQAASSPYTSRRTTGIMMDSCDVSSYAVHFYEASRYSWFSLRKRMSSGLVSADATNASFADTCNSDGELSDSFAFDACAQRLIRRVSTLSSGRSRHSLLMSVLMLRDSASVERMSETNGDATVHRDFPNRVGSNSTEYFSAHNSCRDIFAFRLSWLKVKVARMSTSSFAVKSK